MNSLPAEIVVCLPNGIKAKFIRMFLDYMPRKIKSKKTVLFGD